MGEVVARETVVKVKGKVERWNRMMAIIGKWKVDAVSIVSISPDQRTEYSSPVWTRDINVLVELQVHLITAR